MRTRPILTDECLHGCGFVPPHDPDDVQGYAGSHEGHGTPRRPRLRVDGDDNYGQVDQQHEDGDDQGQL